MVVFDRVSHPLDVIAAGLFGWRISRVSERKSRAVRPVDDLTPLQVALALDPRLSDGDVAMIRAKGIVFAYEAVDLPDAVFREALAEAAKLVRRSILGTEENGACAEAAGQVFLEAASQGRRRLSHASAQPRALM